MAFKGQQGIVAEHTATVVDNADETPPAGFHLHADIGGAGIERVFEQLFDDRRRAFHDFSGGDFVGDLVGEDANASQDVMVTAFGEALSCQLSALSQDVAAARAFLV
jgi:hypothetical protein